jgi:ribosomal protein S24E
MKSIEIINPDLTALTKAQIREKLAKVMKVKEECVTIYGMKNKFGGGRASAFGLIYDSLDAKKKYDAKSNLLRVSRISIQDSQNLKTTRFFLGFVVSVLPSIFITINCLYRIRSSSRARLLVNKRRKSRPENPRSRVLKRQRSTSPRRRSEPQTTFERHTQLLFH